MTSQVQIAKLALQHIGDRFDISDLSDGSPEADQVSLVYDDARRELLRRFPWRFANKYSSPAQLVLASIPSYWDYAYQYPSDAVRIIELVNPLGRDLPPLDFEVSLLSDDTKVILTDQSEPQFRYTADISDPTRFDSLFIKALSYKLASEIAMPLTGEAGIMDAMVNASERYVGLAAEQDASEGRTQKFPQAEWIRARV